MAKEMVIINPQYTEISFKSAVMNEAVAAIVKANMNEALTRIESDLERAKAMYSIYESEAYKADGFKNLEEVGEKLFNYSKQQSYNYKNVGEAIKNGTIQLNDANGVPFSITALAHMLKIPDTSKRNELIASGELSATQTISDLDEVIAENKPARKAAERKEKELSIYCMESDAEPAAVTTLSNFIKCKGEPFHEFKKDGRAYLLYVSDGFATLYYYSTGKVIDTTGEVTPE